MDPKSETRFPKLVLFSSYILEFSIQNLIFKETTGVSERLV